MTEKDKLQKAKAILQELSLILDKEDYSSFYDKMASISVKSGRAK